MPHEAAKLKERLDTYRQTLGTLGMRDYQVCKISLFQVTPCLCAHGRYCSSEFVVANSATAVWRKQFVP